jgi:hypothetical protein
MEGIRRVRKMEINLIIIQPSSLSREPDPLFQPVRSDMPRNVNSTLKSSRSRPEGKSKPSQPRTSRQAMEEITLDSGCPNKMKVRKAKCGNWEGRRVEGGKCRHARREVSAQSHNSLRFSSSSDYHPWLGFPAPSTPFPFPLPSLPGTGAPSGTSSSPPPST